MKIGNVPIEGRVFLAPMAGVTDLPYRILAREFGCGLVYSEMISAQGINYRNTHTLEMLRSDARARPLAVQLFGSNPKSMAQAAQYVESLAVADLIDINMGCPAPKVVKNGEGAALLQTPEKAFAIVRAVADAVSIPVTVKLRKGWDDASVNVVEVARLVERAGAQAVAVHGRTRAAFYGGRADWDAIAAVKKSVRIPVIGNGDVRTCDDLARMFARTGCDAVMVGRAAQGNPWIFRQFQTFLETGTELSPATMQERREVILRHLDMLLEYKGDYIGPREMRKHAAWYTKGLPRAAELRHQFNAAKTREDFLWILDAEKMRETRAENE